MEEEEAVRERGNLAGVQHIILVLSGKGGVGKSTISTELALALSHAGKKVGILDVDLCGPSIPRMLNVQDCDVHQCDSGWVPVFVDQDKSIALMSIGFLLEKPDDAVVWRGPKKNALIKQFVTDVTWGELDFLIVDTPPGTSDEHISIVEALRPYKPLGAILVTTPQAVSVGDVRRELTFCKKTGLRVLGIVENMSGFICPHCTVRTACLAEQGMHKCIFQRGWSRTGQTLWGPTPWLCASGSTNQSKLGGRKRLPSGIPQEFNLPCASRYCSTYLDWNTQPQFLSWEAIYTHH
uniref:Cytosolic Fe-S cluster assembly factor NUBP2 isoform X1 n=1 Tax=Pogona vitticeps TaxID=103695 RepID=A0A6J0UU59_9SAUR